MAKNKDNEQAIIDTQNIVTPSELESIVDMQLELLWNDPTDAKNISPIFIHGSPGIGKSMIIESICKKHNINFIDFRAAQCEPCDVRGLPVPNRELHQMDWYVNGVWPRKQDEKGIIFLDELSSCDRSIQVALYELVLDRRLGQLYSVPPGYLIVAAGNNTSDQAVATTTSSALANRFMHLELQADAEQWCTWARTHEIHPSVIGFISYKPSALHAMADENVERGWPSPRSWARVSKMVFATHNTSILRKIVYGLVGTGWGAEFMAFHELNANFDDVLHMMIDPNAKIVIPNKADRKYALCSTMVYLLWRGKTKEEINERLNGFFRILCHEDMTSDFACMSLIAAMEGKSDDEKRLYSSMIISNKNFPKWRKKHANELTNYMTRFNELSNA